MAAEADLKKVIGGIAPVIARAVPGPLGGVAGTFVAKALGADLKAADPATMAATIAANVDPDLVVKLKQADNEFAEFLKYAVRALYRCDPDRLS